jgi:hypothetical protein
VRINIFCFPLSTSFHGYGFFPAIGPPWQIAEKAFKS